ncbi:MAG: (5-formylfuran-3-yl)methyl phosphate synthase, partial [Piscinibacter sp.]|uniref:(5-formylfuran-3-yl)methyl phosphate synthase n=1 Tax=Piscinibacter sp. TaxID=1903157 RepID=UPI003D0B166E
MIRLLVSVRSVDEALLAAEGGADFIDLKEPAQGALGGLPEATILDIVAALRERGSTLPVSATIGDVPMHELDEILARVARVGACGVDIVKVGIERVPAAGAVLRALAGCGRPL